MDEGQGADVRYIVQLGDIHAGSTLSVMPESFLTTDGNPVGQNKLQKAIWSHWLKMRAWLTERIGGEPYAVILMGDMIEGKHHRTQQIWTESPSEQIEAACQVLEPVCEPARAVFGIRGTECHVGQDRESVVYYRMGVGLSSDGRYHGEHHLRLRVGSHLFSAAHHIGATSRSYLEASGLGIAMGAEMLEAMMGDESVADVYLRAHRHRYGYFANSSAALCVSPAWQALTNHGHKVVTGARVEVGCVLWDVSDRNKLPTHEVFIARPVKRQTVCIGG